jgi:hypothetical protein
MTRIRNAASIVALALAAGTFACGQRQAQVGSAPSQPAQVSIQVRNTLTQAVNVYVNMGGGGDTFLQQVAGNSTVTVAVPGVAPGASVTLRAVTLDGSKTYTRDRATLSSNFTFSLP